MLGLYNHTELFLVHSCKFNYTEQVILNRLLLQYMFITEVLIPPRLMDSLNGFNNVIIYRYVVATEDNVYFSGVRINIFFYSIMLVVVAVKFTCTWLYGFLHHPPTLVYTTEIARTSF